MLYGKIRSGGKKPIDLLGEIIKIINSFETIYALEVVNQEIIMLMEQYLFVFKFQDFRLYLFYVSTV